MKTIKYTILFVVILLTGCSDDWLEIKPKGLKFESNFYQTEQEIYQGLIASYGMLQTKYFSGWSSYYMLASFPSDESEVVGGGSSDRPEYHEVNDFTTTATNSAILQLWRRNYYGIYRANVVIENADPDGGGKSVEYIAEAKFLRAYFYAELVRFFGDVVLITENLSSSEYNQEKTDAEVVYQQIIKDLTEAIPDLAEKDELGADNWRATQSAAQALLGKVYLYMASPYFQERYDFEKSAKEYYTLAAEQFKAVYDKAEAGLYELEPDYNHIWSYEKEHGVESIFEIEYANLEQGGAWDFGRVNGGNIDVQLSGVRGISTDTLASGWGFDMVTEELVAAYDAEGDAVRKDGTTYGESYLASLGVAISSLEKNDGYTGWWSKKRAPWVSIEATVDAKWNYETNERVIRYADVLLMYAEAMIGAGTGDPTIPFNKVRARAKLGTLGTVTMDDIKKERRLELAMEGFRFIDLVRWGDAPSVLGSKGFVEGKHEVFPIPQDEIFNSNNTLTQNDNY